MPCDNPQHAHCGGRARFPCDELLTASGDRICLSPHHCHRDRVRELDLWGMAAFAEAVLAPLGKRARVYPSGRERRRVSSLEV